MRFGFRNNSAVKVPGYYHTFAHNFAVGAVLLGQAVSFGPATQFDVEQRHPDGSVKRAIVSTWTGDYEANQEAPCDVRCIVPSASPANIQPMLPNVVTSLKTATGTVNIAPGSAVFYDTRINGPLMREDRYVAKIDDMLAVFFDIRTYENGTYWVSDSIESPWLQPDNPELRRYDASITHNGVEVRNEPGVKHMPNTRWRTKINDYPLQAMFDMGYYAHIGAIAYYDVAYVPPATQRQAWLKTQASNAALYQSGKIRSGWAATGYGDEESPEPAPVVAYFMTQDADSYFLMIDQAERSGYWDTFYREKDTYRVPTVATQLTFSNHPNYVNKPFGQKAVVDPLIPLDPAITNPALQKNKITLKDAVNLRAEDSHTPQLCYPAELFTGDRWYQEASRTMAFWPAVTTGSATRGGADGLLDWKEIRGRARNLRDVIYAAYLAPDNDPAQAQLRHQVEANFAHMLANSMAEEANTLHALNHASQSDLTVVAPWQNDELATTCAQGVRMGYATAGECLTWCAKYTTGRALGEGQDFRTGAMYERKDKNTATTPVPMTWAYATAESVKAFAPALVDGQIYNPGTAAHYTWYWRGALAVETLFGCPDAAPAFAVVDSGLTALNKRDQLGAEWAFMSTPPPFVAGPAAYVPPVVVVPPPEMVDATIILSGIGTFSGKLTKNI